MTEQSDRSAVDLYWLPLGSGSRVVPTCGRIYEHIAARRKARIPCDLYHAALEARLDGARFTIESAPAWDRPAPDRGVVTTGPVGLPWLGRWKWFRYEVRRWPDGRIPDIDTAVGGPVRISNDRTHARRLLDDVPAFPAATWGRDEQGLGEMWNSNSLIAWLLTRSGHDIDAVQPPAGGRAPGWSAGIAAARRRPSTDAAKIANPRRDPVYGVGTGD